MRRTLPRRTRAESRAPARRWRAWLATWLQARRRGRQISPLPQALVLSFDPATVTASWVWHQDDPAKWALMLVGSDLADGPNYEFSGATRQAAIGAIDSGAWYLVGTTAGDSPPDYAYHEVTPRSNVIVIG
jgi:hypothetical protein